MKVDIDSIIVIIISLLFLVFGGLSRRKKNKPVVKSNLQYKQTSTPTPKGNDLLSEAVSMINDPFAKLEKMFNIPEPTYTAEGESLEEGVEQEPGFTEVIPDKKRESSELPAENESQSLEVIVDEVAEYLKEKEISKSAIKTERKFDEKDLTMQDKPTAGMLELKKKAGIPLFKNVDDIKKAVIYSEILSRKQY